MQNLQRDSGRLVHKRQLTAKVATGNSGLPREALLSFRARHQPLQLLPEPDACNNIPASTSTVNASAPPTKPRKRKAPKEFFSELLVTKISQKRPGQAVLASSDRRLKRSGRGPKAVEKQAEVRKIKACLTCRSDKNGVCLDMMISQL